MSKLSKEKKNHLVLVIVGSLAVMGGLWFGLIQSQQNSLRVLAAKSQSVKRKLEDVEAKMKQADALSTRLDTLGGELSKLEEKMATGDLYEWMLRTISTFKLPYRVDIPAFSTIEVGETALMPKFPYKQVTISITGTARYHEIGKFISDFENEFPRIRIQKLELESSTSQTGDSEKLSFKMDFVALIKSTST